MAGKGDRDRTADRRAFARNHDRIFNREESMIVDPNQRYIVNLYDGFGDSVLAGTILGSEVDQIAQYVDVEAEWAPCRNNCCLNRNGVGQWDGYVVKLSPDTVSVAEYLEQHAEQAAVHNAEVQTTLDAIDNASAGLDSAFRAVFESGQDGEVN
jgi:hypothetical protein